MVPNMASLIFQNMNPLQYSPHQLHLSLMLGTPCTVTFDPATKFLKVTFNRTLSFGSHIHFLHSKFFQRFKAPHSIAGGGEA